MAKLAQAVPLYYPYGETNKGALKTPVCVCGVAKGLNLSKLNCIEECFAVDKI